MAYIQVFYLDGKFQSKSRPNSIEQLRIYLDRIQADWTKHAFTREQWNDARTTTFKGFDPNNAIAESIQRVPDMLTLETTGGRKLVFQNVEMKGGK